MFQLDTLQYTVERTASDLEAVKANVTSLKKEIVDKKDQWVDLLNYKFYLFAIAFIHWFCHRSVGLVVENVVNGAGGLGSILG